MRNLIIGGFAALFLAACVGLLYTLGGFMNVAAVNKDSPPVAWLLHTTYRNSVERRAPKEEAIPSDFDSKDRILAGAQSFVEMCQGCHTPPGISRSVIAEGLNPPPPDLTHIIPHRTPAEAFWVIKHGVRMTGMPAFGPTHDDDTLWSLVAFIDYVKSANPNQYQRLVDQATGALPPDAGLGHRHPAPSSGAKAGGRHAAQRSTEANTEQPAPSHSDNKSGHGGHAH